MGKKRRNTKLQQMKKMVEALQEREGAVASHTHTDLKYNADSHRRRCVHTHVYRKHTMGHIKCMHYTSHTHKKMQTTTHATMTQMDSD